jgi:hypothetical protein
MNGYICNVMKLLQLLKFFRILSLLYCVLISIIILYQFIFVMRGYGDPMTVVLSATYHSIICIFVFAFNVFFMKNIDSMLPKISKLLLNICKILIIFWLLIVIFSQPIYLLMIK